MTRSSKAVATSMLYQYQKWHFFKCKCVTAKKCTFLTTWTVVTRPTHMIFTQKVLPQVELIRSNFPDQKTFDQWLIISRKHPVTLRKKKLHPDLGYTDCLNLESCNLTFTYSTCTLTWCGNSKANIANSSGTYMVNLIWCQTYVCP